MSGARAPESLHIAPDEHDADDLYERAPVGYVTTRPDGTIDRVNQTLLDWIGYARDEIVGRRTFAQLLTAGGRIYHETHVRPMLQMQGHCREIALDLVRADGRRLPALVNSVLDRDESGAPTRVRTAVFDATERREYERELLRAKQRAEDSEQRAQRLARTLQQTLIPPAPPTVAGLEIAAAYRPAGSGDEVGGDFYDVFQVADGDWAVVIGDVRGKGVDAAVVTSLARYTIRAAAVQHAHPSRTLRVLNDVLVRHGDEDFCTVALVRLREREGRWTATVCCGGHPLPLVAGPDRSVRAVGRAGSLLGILARPALHDVDVALPAGEALVLYTDGVTEGRRGRTFFGEDRLEAAVARHAGSAQGLTDGVLGEVLAFQADHPRDDIALVAVQAR